MNNKKRKLIIRIVALVLAGLMVVSIFSILLSTIHF
ncbi:unknown [Clostridium sp. CAG:352]|jgi:hypothetical protein|nr:unknown [Clostridium sp. CAG:352]SCJ65343.1 Uncharacterised protein [uncultured Ruminococcus sp.]SCJ68818.1 Uncharacterised protein [uncultured Ruminococcus sp.]